MLLNPQNENNTSSQAKSAHKEKKNKQKNSIRQLHLGISPTLSVITYLVSKPIRIWNLVRQERLPRKEADKNQNRNNHNRAYTLYQHLSVMTTVKWNCYKTVTSLTPSAIRITTTHNKEEHKKSLSSYSRKVSRKTFSPSHRCVHNSIL